jgi:hypothetical protein
VSLKSYAAAVQRRKRRPELSGPLIALSTPAENQEAERRWRNTGGHTAIDRGAERLSLAVTQAPDHQPANPHGAGAQHSLR